MVTVHVPALLRDATGGQERVEIEIPESARLSIAELLERIDQRFPGFRDGLLYEGDLMPGIAVFIDNEQAMLGLRSTVAAGSEVRFIPPVVGGC